MTFLETAGFVYVILATLGFSGARLCPTEHETGILALHRVPLKKCEDGGCYGGPSSNGGSHGDYRFMGSSLSPVVRQARPTPRNGVNKSLPILFGLIGGIIVGLLLAFVGFVMLLHKDAFGFISVSAGLALYAVCLFFFLKS